LDNPDPPEGIPFGTGFLVGETALLTHAHVSQYSFGGGVRISRAKPLSGFQGGSTASSMSGGDDEKRHAFDSNCDVAILVVITAAGGPGGCHCILDESGQSPHRDTTV